MSLNRDAMQTFFQKVWTEENSDYVAEMLKPEDSGDLVHGLQKEEGLTPAAFVGFQKAMLGLVKDVHITIDSFIEKGDTIAARCTMNAISRKANSNLAVCIKGSVIAKMKNGIILEAHNYFDFLHLFEQLELLPKDTMAKCMSGKGIG